MYPHRELSRLEVHKTALRQRISHRRAVCTAAAARAMRPVAWLDRLLGLWRRLSPVDRFAVIPLLLLKSPATLRTRLLGRLLRWAPLVLGAARGLAARHRE